MKRAVIRAALQLKDKGQNDKEFYIMHRADRKVLLGIYKEFP